MFDRTEAEKIFNRLNAVSDQAQIDMNRLREKNSGWHRDTDIRLTGFAKLINAHGAAALGIKFYTDNLINPEWWDQNACGYSVEDKRRRNRAFLDVHKIGLIQVGFVAVESSLRELLRNIDPMACNNSTDAFKNIYDCLIKTKLNINSEYCDLLDLMRIIRNTIHNNGVFYSTKGNDINLFHKGTEYKFEHGKKPNFITWDLICDLHEDLSGFFVEVSEHQIVGSLPGTIDDPYSR